MSSVTQTSLRNMRVGWRPFLLTLFVTFILLETGLAKDQVAPPSLPFGQNEEPPLHPTIIMAEHEGHLYPVTDVSEGKAQIELGGKMQPLPVTQRYAPMRARAYLFGYIEFKDQETVARTAGFGNGLMQYCDFRAKLSSEHSYKDCYLAILCYDRSYVEGDNDDASAVIVFKKIGDIEAGGRKTVREEFDYLDAQSKRYYYFPMVFSHGREIRSNLSEEAAKFFRRLELRSHQKLMVEFRRKYRRSDRPLEAYLRIQPVLPDTPRVDGPIDINVDFRVTEGGTMEDLRIVQQVTPEIEHAIRRALDGWLFFPRLVGGAAVSTQVQMPLAIQPTPARP